MFVNVPPPPWVTQMLGYCAPQRPAPNGEPPRPDVVERRPHGRRQIRAAAAQDLHIVDERLFARHPEQARVRAD